MTMTTTFQKVAEELSGAFLEDARNDGKKFFKFADDAPDWLKGSEVSLACHKALDDRLPDDWVYKQMYYLAERLTEYETAEAARDAIGEIADGLVDVYNTDRAKWLAMNINNAELCNEAVAELGACKEDGIFEMIGMGQYLAIERIGGALIDCVQAEADSREGLDEDND